MNKWVGLIQEHGASFVAVYASANLVTLAPLFAALHLGGLDGPELLSQLATYVGIELPNWFHNDNSKLAVNGLIAFELNGWLEPLRLPLVLALTPRATAYFRRKK